MYATLTLPAAGPAVPTLDAQLVGQRGQDPRFRLVDLAVAQRPVGARNVSRKATLRVPDGSSGPR